MNQNMLNILTVPFFYYYVVLLDEIHHYLRFGNFPTTEIKQVSVK